MTENERQIEIAVNEGYGLYCSKENDDKYDQFTEKIAAALGKSIENQLRTQSNDVRWVDPLLIASDEGMFDRRENMSRLEVDVPTLIQRNEGLV